jgi:TonB family protein
VAFGVRHSLIAATLLAGVGGQQPIQSGFGAGAYRPGDGITDPVLIHEVRPDYPGAAMARKLAGSVFVEAIVKADGTIGEVRVDKSLDSQYGVDAAALAAVRKWRFEPAKLNTVPVAIVISAEVEFVLHSYESGGPTEAEREAEFLKSAGAHRASDDGVVAPVVVRPVPVRHTPAAQVAKIQGVVEIDVVVLPNGTVGPARVRKSLDTVHGLDDEALDIAKRYLFKPDSGTVKGVPAPVVVTLTFEFKLR